MLTKEEKKQQKITKKDAIWKEKYGVLYSDVLNKIDKHETSTKNIRKILKNFKGIYPKLALMFFCGIVISFIGIIPSILNEKFLAYLTTIPPFFKEAFILCVYIAIVTIIKQILSYIYSIITNKFICRTLSKLRIMISTAVQQTSTSQFDTTASGTIINRIINSTSKFTDKIFGLVEQSLVAITSFFYIVFACYLNIWLGLVLVTIGLIDFLINFFYLIFLRKKLARRNILINEKIMSEETEVVRGIRDVKFLGISSTILDKFKKSTQQKENSNFNNSLIGINFNKLRSILVTILNLGFVAFSLYFIYTGQIALSVFLVLLLYKNQILSFFFKSGAIFSNIQEAEIAAEKINEILETYPKDTFGNNELVNVQGKIEFKNVSFSYNGQEKLFENINLTIKSHECVAFVGKSGQGKSTIINLISKLYDVTSGAILIDDINIKDLTEQCLRKNISVVQQSPYIFNLSIKENLLLAKPDATDKEIKDVCQKAHIDKFIETLPQKYDTIVGEGGITLSGGQRQRLAIARTILQDAQIIIFDEATSALDNQSQQIVQETIFKMKNEKTIIVVAHRLTTIKDCDRIFVIDDNKIIADGSHSYLIENCETYKNLYKTENI